VNFWNRSYCSFFTCSASFIVRIASELFRGDFLRRYTSFPIKRTRLRDINFSPLSLFLSVFSSYRVVSVPREELRNKQILRPFSPATHFYLEIYSAMHTDFPHAVATSHPAFNSSSPLASVAALTQRAQCLPFFLFPREKGFSPKQACIPSSRKPAFSLVVFAGLVHQVDSLVNDRARFRP